MVSTILSILLLVLVLVFVSLSVSVGLGLSLRLTSSTTETSLIFAIVIPFCYYQCVVKSIILNTMIITTVASLLEIPCL